MDQKFFGGHLSHIRVATDTGITGKYLNILEKYFILELYLKNTTFLEKSWKIEKYTEIILEF